MTDFSRTIIVGTSPISLIKAILLNLEKKNVSIIEKRFEIGGCWQSGNFEYISFDLGCHFLVPFDDDFRNKLIIKELKKFGISAELEKLPALFERKIDEIKNYSEEHKYIKVKGGYSSITNVLHKAIKHLGIPIINDNIKSVTLANNSISLIGERTTHTSEKLFIPSYCDISSIQANKTKIELECSRQESHHLVFIVNGVWSKRNYNYYFLNESEQSAFDKLSFHKGATKDFFNIRVGKNNKGKSDKALIELGEKFIESLGYEISSISFVQRHIYKFPFRSEKIVRNLQKEISDASFGKIKMLYTRNFTQALLEICK